MYNISHNCNDFYLCSDYISTIFKDKSLEKIDIKIEQNCCGNTIFDQSINLLYPDEGCLYQASYCNFEEQQVCPGTPREGANCGLNPLSSYYFELRNLIVKVNGGDTDVLNSNYDMTVESEVTRVNEDVNKYLQDNGFKNASVEIVTYLTNTEYLCVDIQFKNLPNGVIPKHFLLANRETCYITSDFICLEKQESTCILKSSENDAFLLSEHQIGLDFSIIIGKIMLEDDSILEIPGATFTTGTYLTSLELAVDQVNLHLAGIGSSIIIESVINTDGSFYFKTSDPSVKGVFIKSTVTENPEYVAFLMECLEYSDPCPTCVYQVKIDTNVLECVPKYINAILAYYPEDVASTCIYSDSITLDNYSFSNIEVEDGVYTISIETSEYVPDQLIMESVGGQKLFFDFICNEVNNFPDSYNPDVLEFNGQCIIAKIGYLEDGIYNITITTETADEVITENYCCFVDCKTKCLIANLQSLEDVITAYSLYETIKFGETCNEDCTCDNMCKIYKELVSFLKNSPIYEGKCKTKKETPCGCKSSSCGCGDTYMWGNTKYSISD